MSVTITGTGITLNDGSVITTAIPAVNGVGTIKTCCYIATSPYPSGINSWNITNYTAGTTSAGSSLASDFYGVNNTGWASGSFGYAGEVMSIRREAQGRTSIGFLASSGNSTAIGGGGYIQFVGGIFPAGYRQNPYSYSTQSGSWRSLIPFSHGSSFHDYANLSAALWSSVPWQRYA